MTSPSVNVYFRPMMEDARRYAIEATVTPDYPFGQPVKMNVAMTDTHSDSPIRRSVGSKGSITVIVKPGSLNRFLRVTVVYAYSKDKERMIPITVAETADHEAIYEAWVLDGCPLWWTTADIP